jgi:hypothetical protein
MNKIANTIQEKFHSAKVACSEESLQDLSSLGKDMEWFIKGALTNTAELI